MKIKEPIQDGSLRPFTVNDAVLTPISARYGRIIKIEQTPLSDQQIYLMYQGMPAVNSKYTVSIKLPSLHSDTFKEVLVICFEYELKR